MGAVSPLKYAECLTLLRAGTVGRVAVTTPGGPHIVLVNYRVVADEITIRTQEGSLLARWAADAAVAFEVDLVDHEYWRGWSVVAHGVAGVTPAGDERPTPRPWANGERRVLVRVRWTSLTGRKVGVGWDCLEAMPARIVE